MRSLRSGLAIAAMMLAVLVTQPTALAQPDTAAAGCQHSAGSGSVLSAGYIRAVETGATVGVVQLCRSGSSYWAFMAMSMPMPPNHWGIADLIRYVDGRPDGTWSCSVHAEPGRPMCWTPRIDGTAGTTFVARARVCRGVFPTCEALYAYGQTARTR